MFFKKKKHKKKGCNCTATKKNKSSGFGLSKSGMSELNMKLINRKHANILLISKK